MTEAATPMFRVTLRRWDHLHVGPFFNPFLADIWRKRSCTERVWKFRAKDETEVRQLYHEAKAADFDNVRGFDLIRIERVQEFTDAGGHEVGKK